MEPNNKIKENNNNQEELVQLIKNENKDNVKDKNSSNEGNDEKIQKQNEDGELEKMSENQSDLLTKENNFDEIKECDNKLNNKDEGIEPQHEQDKPEPEQLQANLEQQEKDKKEEQENQENENQQNRIQEIEDDQILDFESKSPNEWSNENVKNWIYYKKILGTDRDREANTEEYEKRDGKSLFEIAKSKDTFKMYTEDSKNDKSFSSVLFDDLKERIDLFYRKNLLKTLVNKIVQIRIVKKRMLWQPEIYYSVGVRIGGNLILSSTDGLTNFNEKNQMIEIGYSNKWHSATLLDLTDPMEPTNCALLKINENHFNGQQQKEDSQTFPIFKKQYTINSEIFYFDFPACRIPQVSTKDKQFKDVKPLSPSIFTGRISFIDDNTLEVHLNGTDINEFDNKSRIIFTCKNGEICGLIRKKSHCHQYLKSNVLYCTKSSSIQAWVDTTLKKLQNPPLWE